MRSIVHPRAIYLPLGFLLLASSGCELIASFDRDTIPEPGFSVPDATTLPPDGVIEGGLPEPDAGMDASVDAGADGGMDASIDAGEDDAGESMDATVDSGEEDGGM